MDHIKHLRPTTLAAIIADLREGSAEWNAEFRAVWRALVANVGETEAERMIEEAKA
jgi:hypothetical protein